MMTLELAVEKLNGRIETLDERLKRGLNGARVLVLGVAYKKNVDDMRESPSLRLIEMIEERGGQTVYHDPHIAEIPMTREHAALAGRRSVALTAEAVAGYDAVVVATDHDAVDYRLVVENAKLVVDTRNVCARHGLMAANVVKA